MKKYLVIIIILLFQSCSMFMSSAGYVASEGWKKNWNQALSGKGQYENKKRGGNDFAMSYAFVSDSVNIYPETVYINNLWSFGPAYIPVIPNIAQPFICLFRKKKIVL